MKIAIIGPGSMGLLYGGYLSRNNNVYMFGRDTAKMQEINANGITITENDNSTKNYKVTATTDSNEIGTVDLAIVFVKAYATENALANCKSIIGPNTILMTLQNGLGHDTIFTKYANPDNIIIGNTNQGSSRINNYSIRHSGLGDTFFGVISGNVNRFEEIRAEFEKCGFPCKLSDTVKQIIWNKLMINASSSVLSGVLGMPQGYVESNPYAWNMAKKLITEMCATATADGYPFDSAEQIDRIQKHLQAAPDGLTSIYNDLKSGNPTEVSFINGAVVDIAKKLNVPVPTHEIIVDMVHAMEGR